MKILHTSDWHLGKILHEHSLIEDQIYLLKKLVDYITTNPHDLMIIAGDIYDRSIPPREAVKAFSDFLVSLRQVSNIPVVIIPGNHDSSQRVSYLSELLVSKNIFINGDPETLSEPIAVGDAHIYAIPFLDPYVFDFVSDEPSLTVSVSE